MPSTSSRTCSSRSQSRSGNEESLGFVGPCGFLGFCGPTGPVGPCSGVGSSSIIVMLGFIIVTRVLLSLSVVVVAASAVFSRSGTAAAASVTIIVIATIVTIAITSLLLLLLLLRLLPLLFLLHLNATTILRSLQATIVTSVVATTTTTTATTIVLATPVDMIVVHVRRHACPWPFRLVQSAHRLTPGAVFSCTVVFHSPLLGDVLSLAVARRRAFTRRCSATCFHSPLLGVVLARDVYRRVGMVMGGDPPGARAGYRNAGSQQGLEAVARGQQRGVGRRRPASDTRIRGHHRLSPLELEGLFGQTS